MENLFLESMIEKIIHSLQTLEGTVVEKDKSYDVSMRDWAWPQGVALFAMYQYYATKRDPALLKYLADWFAEHFEAVATCRRKQHMPNAYAHVPLRRNGKSGI